MRWQQIFYGGLALALYVIFIFTAPVPWYWKVLVSMWVCAEEAKR